MALRHVSAAEIDAAIAEAIAQAVAAIPFGGPVAHVTAPDATDGPSSITLANANKVAINALIVLLESLGYLIPA
jgi:hypothetical protein